ncbi:MAG: metallophosphoesterase family protein [Deltaproteobacteria bacterium]|nr:metallophosphoesterase family protein [Deltaproteobacteria bacterium]MBW1925022.1 metallophosphoesterase family protein [Deltaproteobacteria bacterium]MBW1950171.1 metallophosphoesterase family protein [Deltaproteobacteria bacterium]MBW2007987.1 metallophosphoesterase family protein [Deltaproteobacteria bacterium]MBW2101851.1 metallophosphoesterase family protein [Deltaproteobacteria bacterium]
MRIAVLSDTHLREVTKGFRALYRRYLERADLVVHAGDWTGLEVVRFLQKGPFRGVHGNMDPPEVRQVLPAKQVLELGGYRIGLIHGWGSSRGLEDRLAQEFDAVDAIVYGHSHEFSNHVRDGILFFNPGAATGYAPTGRNSLGILELGEEMRGMMIPL